MKRLVSIWRDSQPLPDEKSPNRIAVQSYGAGVWGPITVASGPFVDTPRWQQFLVDDRPRGDSLLAALKAGPVKPVMYGDA